ncbi:hypothetical protein [Flavobacterium sandaracinum]|uniref:Uncharacterized protein n=1 Tax=Flavobacterium sandaracinum TaxID=2541733 RepID=A0A4R5CH84_9FLAO|nr:hypothetical protein [Flavobacterium sandaracinum]TDD99095.1 hypothetical protein E0F91_17385 [Flavobacterium sandaracinum]
MKGDKQKILSAYWWVIHYKTEELVQMKKYILIIFLFSFSLIWSQKSNHSKNQKIYLKEAQESLNKSDNASAIGFYTYVYEINPNNDLGKRAKIKSDSLKSLPRKKYIESIIGKWKLNKIGSNWGFENYKDSLINRILIIDKNKLIFFEENKITKELKKIKSEDLIFLSTVNEDNYSNEFLFSDNQIWWLGIDKNNSQLRQMNTGEKNKDGRTEIVCGNSELYYTRLEN